MKFPIFRRYKNHKSYFKIISQSEFTEYKEFGGKLEKHKIKASILPDRNYIQDMISDFENHWEIIDEQQFEAFLAEFEAVP